MNSNFPLSIHFSENPREDYVKWKTCSLIEQSLSGVRFIQVNLTQDVISQIQRTSKNVEDKLVKQDILPNLEKIAKKFAQKILKDIESSNDCIAISCMSIVKTK